MLYLSEETFRKNGVRKNSEVYWYSSAGNMFPNCAKYADALSVIADKKEIIKNLNKTVFKVDKNNRKVYFRDNNTKEVIE